MKRKTHIRRAGFEALQLLVRHPGGLSVGAMAILRNGGKAESRNTLRNLVALDYAVESFRPGPTGRRAAYFAITDKGRQVLDQFLTQPEDEDADESDERWPRDDPAEVVRQAVRTQPTSVFDVARVMRSASA